MPALPMARMRAPARRMASPLALRLTAPSTTRPTARCLTDLPSPMRPIATRSAARQAARWFANLHRKKRNVTYAALDCSGCALKPQCTTAPRRLIKRHLDEDALNRMNARADPTLMTMRRCAAEHPFGTIKRMTAGGRFLTRNLKGTRTEMALSVLAYNLLRAINLKAAIA